MSTPSYPSAAEVLAAVPKQLYIAGSWSDAAAWSDHAGRRPGHR